MTYELANGSTLVHFIGTIWAETLYEVSTIHPGCFGKLMIISGFVESY